MRLTSTHNPVIKYVRSLERAAVRRENGVYVVEGVRLVREALSSHQTASLALYDADALRNTAEGVRLLTDVAAWAHQTYEVAPHVMKAAAQTESPSGVLIVLKLPAAPECADQRDARLGVILDTVSDPGNAGTIIRTALAAGAEYLASTAGSVDLFSPKVVRAGMGAHFKLPLYPGTSWDELRHNLPGTTFVAASATARQSVYHFSWPERTALIIGGEAQGLSSEAESAVQARVRIPMERGVESLNAAIAAGILLYAARSSIPSSES